MILTKKTSVVPIPIETSLLHVLRMNSGDYKCRMLHTHTYVKRPLTVPILTGDVCRIYSLCYR